MERAYQNIIKERIENYGVSSLTDDEALSVITGIPLTEAKKHLDTYGLLELINFKDHMNLTNPQSKKLALLYHLLKGISPSNFKPKTPINSSTKAGGILLKSTVLLKE